MSTDKNENRTKIKCNQDFLTQIPEWEQEYKESDELQINYTPVEWKQAEAVYTDHDLQILGEPVMEDWEEPYMKVLADAATRNGGRVLEVGYGMGISARFIQQTPIQEHIIIEANHAVAIKAKEWANTCKTTTVILEGLWQEAMVSIANDSLDGILFDTYPLSEAELYQNHFSFFEHAFAKLKNGGIFTYYSDEVSRFSDVHLARLHAAGFSPNGISSQIVNVTPPSGCLYWKAKTILAPIVRK